MFIHRIRYRIIFLFVVLVVAILLISGYSLHWRIRSNFEALLGTKLVAVAKAASVQFSGGEVRFLLEGAGPRTLLHLRSQINYLKSSTNVKRIYFFDLNGRRLLDTESENIPDTPYFRLNFYKNEFENITRGEASYSILFQGIDGLPTMTGFAPLYLDKKVVGGVGVEGSATFLNTVKRMRYNLYLIGILGSITAIVLGIILAESITRPIGKLVRASERIGHGDYTGKIPLLARDEIGLLSETMESMRKGIIQREKELKAMLAGVAHEIRNPIGGVELFTGILNEELEGQPKIQKHVEKIEKEIKYLKNIVDNFMEYAKPKKPDPESCSLLDITKDTLSLLEKDIKHKNISIKMPNSGKDIKVWADSVHLKRIFLNLIKNSIQAIPDDGGTIKIEWLCKNGSVQIKISDTGVGIPNYIQREIFTPFFTTKEKGTGLGLSIVKDLLEKNNGRIVLKCSNSRGTEFDLVLPIDKRD